MVFYNICVLLLMALLFFSTVCSLGIVSLLNEEFVIGILLVLFWSIILCIIADKFMMYVYSIREIMYKYFVLFFEFSIQCVFSLKSVLRLETSFQISLARMLIKKIFETCKVLVIKNWLRFYSFNIYILKSLKMIKVIAFVTLAFTYISLGYVIVSNLLKKELQC